LVETTLETTSTINPSTITVDPSTTFEITTTDTTTTYSTTTDTTTIDSTTTICADPGCAYGQIWDSIGCKCNCQVGFFGILCDTVDCNIALDATECSLGLFTCADPISFQSCPTICGLC
jgi:hypothetical protein